MQPTAPSTARRTHEISTSHSSNKCYATKRPFDRPTKPRNLNPHIPRTNAVQPTATDPRTQGPWTHVLIGPWAHEPVSTWACRPLGP